MDLVTLLGDSGTQCSNVVVRRQSPHHFSSTACCSEILLPMIPGATRCDRVVAAVLEGVAKADVLLAMPS